MAFVKIIHDIVTSEVRFPACNSVDEDTLPPAVLADMRALGVIVDVVEPEPVEVTSVQVHKKGK